MAALQLLGLVTMVLSLGTAAPGPPSKPTPARTGCHIGSFQSLSPREKDAFKKARNALVRCCCHNGLPLHHSIMKMVACHCGLTSDLL